MLRRESSTSLGRRGVFGGAVLNMHMPWKKHETVKVICNSCKPGQVHEYAEEIVRLSGGVPIQVIVDDTIIFYRGKNYVQPEIMSPVDTLSKKRHLKSQNMSNHWSLLGVLLPWQRRIWSSVTDMWRFKVEGPFPSWIVQ